MEFIADGREQQPDPLLLELARHGDMDAFGELLRRHHEKCVNMATILLRNRWDAEDEVQNAFSKAHAHLDQYGGGAAFSTWLLRIVMNQCLMFMRGKRRNRFVRLDETPSKRNHRPLELPTCDSDPEGELGIGEMRRLVRTAVGDVPPLLRNAIVLRYLHDLPITDVAETLQISVPAAKSRLFRARTQLRVRWKKRYKSVGNVLPLSHAAAPLTRVVHHCATDA
jgi:RNA polymerase sigma-70 factor (ECF subfamily)